DQRVSDAAQRLRERKRLSERHRRVGDGRHDQGTGQVLADPETIVVLNSPAGEVAAELGVTSVAVASSAEEIMPWQEGVARCHIRAPWNIADDSAYEQLSDIAPVIVPRTESANPDWDDMTKQVGEALGRADEADELIDETKARLSDVGSDLGTEAKSYQLISPRSEGIYFGNAAP